MDRSELWNKVEAHHKRGDAVVAREFEISLPRQLSQEQREALAFEYAASVAERYGVAADVNLHAPDRVTDEMLQADPDRFYVTENGIRHNANWHMHLQLSACYVDADGQLGKKCVELDPIHVQRQNSQRKKDGLEPLPNAVEAERALWADMCNRHLEQAGLDVRVDHRSFADRGITDRAPTKHHGVHARAIERKTGEKSDRRLADEAAMRERAQEAAQQKIEEATIAAEIAAAEHEIEVLQLDLAELELDQRIKAQPAPEPERLPRTPAPVSSDDIRRALVQARERWSEPSEAVDRLRRVREKARAAEQAQRELDKAQDRLVQQRDRLERAPREIKKARKDASTWRREHRFLSWWHDHIKPVSALVKIQERGRLAEQALPGLKQAVSEATEHHTKALKIYLAQRDDHIATRAQELARLEELARPDRERIQELEKQLAEALEREREKPKQEPEPPQAVEQAQPVRWVEGERSEPASYPRPRG